MWFFFFFFFFWLFSKLSSNIFFLPSTECQSEHNRCGMFGSMGQIREGCEMDSLSAHASQARKQLDWRTWQVWQGLRGGPQSVKERRKERKEGREEENKEIREAGREGRKKEGFICGTHISLTSAAALLCHLLWKLSQGTWLLSAGGTMCVRVPGTQQAVNKVRVTPTLALAVKGAVAQGTSQIIFPPGLHHARGSQDPQLLVSPREATEYQGLLWPPSHSMCPYGKCVSAWKTQSSWCVHKHRPPSLSFGVPTSYSSHTSSPWVLFTCFPLHLASSMDGRSFPAMFGSMAGNGQGEVRGGMVGLTRSYKDQLCGGTSIALDVQSIIQRVNLLPAFLLYFFMLKMYLSQLSGKESACQAGHMGLIPGLGRFPWRRKWQPSPVFLPGKSRGQRSVVSYSP